MAPAQVQHPDNTLLKSKSPDNMACSHHQSVCAMYTLNSRLHPKVWLLRRLLHQALWHRTETCIKLCFRAQSCPYYLLLSGWKVLPTVHVGLHLCGTYLCKCWMRPALSLRFHSENQGPVSWYWSPKCLKDILSVPSLRGNALCCTGHANMFVSSLKLAIDSNYSGWWWGK